MRRWALLAIVPALVVALAGCLSHHDGAPEPAAPVQDAPPAVNVTAPPVAPPPAPEPARFKDAGLSWSGCRDFSGAYDFKHEWAAGLVPDDYPMTTVLPGAIGGSSFQAYDCEGLSIGNQTFVPAAQFGLFGIRVEPPEDRAHVEGNLFVLDLFVSNATIARQLAEAGLPVRQAAIHIGESSATIVDSPEASLRAEVAQRSATDNNQTAPGRLHWLSGGFACWADIDHIYEVLGRSYSTLQGLAGNPKTVAGPAGELPGFSSDGVESGSLRAPVCGLPA
jgi:hypothetical protein